MPANETLSFFINDTQINCTVYSLSGGLMMYQEVLSDVWSSNVTKGLLPAFFLTNCTMLGEPLLQAQRLQALFEYQLDNDPYFLRDNGDALVSLLFTVCGACVTCWMLVVVQFLSPGNKRKPFLTLLATVVYTAVLTVLLAKVTMASRLDYYTDVLDVLEIHSVVYNNLAFRITQIFSELFIQLAFLQMVQKCSPKKFKEVVWALYLVLIVVYIIICSYSEGTFQGDTRSVMMQDAEGATYLRWLRIRVFFKLVFVLIVTGLMGYYTIVMKTPRKTSYSRRLIPLAVFVWFLVAAHIVVCILVTAVYNYDWHTRSWLSIIPSVIEIGILTSAWEWISNIKSLEKRAELMGVLGRRISLDDVNNFHDNKTSSTKPLKSSKDLLDWVKTKYISKYPTEANLVDSETNSKLESTSDDMNNQNTNELETQTPPQHPQQQTAHVDEDEDVQYVDYDIYDESDNLHNHNLDDILPPADGSHQNNPPPFEPHPGFLHNDYWPDTKR